MSLIQCLRDEAALPTTFSKAVQVVEDAGVLSSEDTPSEIRGVVRLSGTVSSSHGSSYRSHVTLGLDDEEIIDYGCTCPASLNYTGMCKHAIALALEYLHDTAVVDVPAAQTAATSPRLSSLMGTLALQSLGSVPHRTTPLHPEALVDLRVTLAPGSARDPYEPWRLSLAVARGSVVAPVRDINALVHAWRTGAEASYGRGLTFVHRPAAVTPVARRLCDLIARVVQSQQASNVGRYAYASSAAQRVLALSEGDVVALLDALDDAPFTCESSRGGTPRTLRVASGDPVLAAALVASPEGGFDLHLPAPLDGCAAAGRLYLLDDTCAWSCSEGFSAKAATLCAGLLPAWEPLHIAEEDLGTFCYTVLPVLRACTQLEIPPELEALVPPEPRFTFALGLDNGEVTCTAQVAYGDDVLDLFEPQRPGQPVRDVAAEYRAQEVVEAYIPASQGAHRFDESDDELLFALLTEGLSELADVGEVLLSERLRAIKVHQGARLRVGASLYHGLLDLEVGASGMTPHDLEEYLRSYRRRQRFVRLSNGDIVRIGAEARTLDDLATGLDATATALAQGVRGLPLSRGLFVEQLLRGVRSVRFDRNEELRRVVEAFDASTGAAIELPHGLRGVLRPYQEEGVRWLATLERLGLGGILADDMGLGKTLQVIAYVAACKEANGGGPTLVVAPASLVYNWMAELARFAPQLAGVAVVGTKARREVLINRATDYDVLVTSYDLMKRDVELYVRQRFARVVLDEAQYIKNPATQVALSAKCLPAATRFALTGTPVENRILELWSIFDFLMPGMLGTRKSFAERFEGAVENQEEGAAERLRCLVAPFILRRLKSDVLTELPEKHESVVYAQMTGEQERLYKAAQDRLALQITREQPRSFERKKLQVLAELTKLRQLCCDPRLCFEDYRGGSAKLDTCLELVRSAVDSGHRVLVFSQFTSMLSLIGERLQGARIPYLVLTGATPRDERSRLVTRFQHEEAPVFLVSLKAGGVGLTLTAADVVIHYDPWWNLAAQNQATDRAYRLGQERAVSVCKLVTAGTIEERIVAMQERKRDLVQSVLGSGELGSTELSREDVLGLLGV